MKNYNTDRTSVSGIELCKELIESLHAAGKHADAYELEAWLRVWEQTLLIHLKKIERLT
jgi:hypothetical protein